MNSLTKIIILLVFQLLFLAFLYTDVVIENTVVAIVVIMCTILNIGESK